MPFEYKLKKHKKKHYVEEKETGYKFGPYETETKAKEHMRFLNMGGGFDGFTPSFIVKEENR